MRQLKKNIKILNKRDFKETFISPDKTRRYFFETGGKYDNIFISGHIIFRRKNMGIKNFLKEHRIEIRIILIILTILWMILIFSLSSQTSHESSKLSQRFIANGLSFLGFDFTQTFAGNVEILDGIQFIVRKSAHMFLYTILSVLVSLIAMTYDFKQNKKIMLSFTSCVLYAISDEIHQLFIQGRSGGIFDVGIDTIGIIIGIMLAFRIWAKITIDKMV